MKRVLSKLTLLFMGSGLAMALSACATSFTGSPHVEGGRSGCESKCKAQGMEMAGMVYMGEYSDACVCSVPGATSMRKEKLLADAATAGGAAGVVMQMRRNEEQNGHNNMIFIH